MTVVERESLLLVYVSLGRHIVRRCSCRGPHSTLKVRQRGPTLHNVFDLCQIICPRAWRRPGAEPSVIYAEVAAGLRVYSTQSSKPA